MKILKTRALLLNLAYILQSSVETDQASPGTHEALSLDCKRHLTAAQGTMTAL